MSKTYTVLRAFTDDVGGGVYYAGQQYPRAGVILTEERIEYLGSDKNRTGAPVIQVEKQENALADMTLAELKVFAKESDIDLGSAKKKEEILAAIEAAKDDVSEDEMEEPEEPEEEE